MSNWFIVGCYIKCATRKHERQISSHSHLSSPCCDVPLILIFSSQMRAILAITVHFNFRPLNGSWLWCLPLAALPRQTLLTFMCLEVWFSKTFYWNTHYNQFLIYFKNVHRLLCPLDHKSLQNIYRSSQNESIIKKKKSYISRTSGRKCIVSEQIRQVRRSHQTQMMCPKMCS